MVDINPVICGIVLFMLTYIQVTIKIITKEYLCEYIDNILKEYISNLPKGDINQPPKGSLNPPTEVSLNKPFEMSFFKPLKTPMDGPLVGEQLNVQVRNSNPPKMT